MVSIILVQNNYFSIASKSINIRGLEPILHFYIRGKLFIIRCEEYLSNLTKLDPPEEPEVEENQPIKELVTFIRFKTTFIFF